MELAQERNADGIFSSNATTAIFYGAATMMQHLIYENPTDA